MLVQIHCATVRGLLAAGFKYHVEDKSDSINLSRQITHMYVLIEKMPLTYEYTINLYIYL